MINRKNTYKSKSNNETDDKKAKPALQHCSRNKGVRTPGPAVLTALRKPAAFALSYVSERPQFSDAAAARALLP